jgi:uncharacterized protein YbjT (DUF2867 family)
MILVTGATGNIGRPLVSQLCERRIPVRVLTRNIDDAKKLFGPSVEIMTADMNDDVAVARALAGVKQLLLLSPASQALAEHEASILTAAQKAGVQRVVYISALNAAPDAKTSIARLHAKTEAAIQASGLAWTILRPHGFMQNLLRGAAATIKREGVFYNAAGDGRISMIDCTDVAASAVGALVDEGHNLNTYELTGPEALSYAEMAAKLSKHLGKPVRYVDIPPAALLGGLKSAGMPSWLADDVVAMSGDFAAGNGRNVTHDVERLAHRPARAFDHFLDDFGAAFGD